MKFNTYYQYQPLVDFKAPILPGIGLGGIRLDSPLSSLKDWIIFNVFSENKDNLSVEAFNGIYLNYEIGGKVDIIINAIDGKIEKLGCKPGYEGDFENIRPGVLIREVIRPEMGPYANNGFIFLRKYPGIEIDIPDSLEDYEEFNELPNFMIERIYVGR